jgi:hypothetical protein
MIARTQAIEIDSRDRKMCERPMKSRVVLYRRRRRAMSLRVEVEALALEIVDEPRYLCKHRFSRQALSRAQPIEQSHPC